MRREHDNVLINTETRRQKKVQKSKQVPHIKNQLTSTRKK